MTDPTGRAPVVDLERDHPMRLILSERQIDRIIAGGPGSLALGAFLMSLGFVLPKGFGLGLTGFMVLSGGIYAGTLRRWRTEPGLWMLALFLTLMLGGCWAYFEWLIIQNMLGAGGGNPARPQPDQQRLMFALDSSLAWLLFGRIVWFCASIAVRNRSVTKL